MSLDLNKEIDDIVRPPLLEPKTNWYLVASASLGTLLLLVVIGWFTGFVVIGPSHDTAASDVPIEGISEMRIKGNRVSRIYHLPQCQSYNSIKQRNIRWFNSEENAIAARYRKAKNC